jgi:hypothetical protein
MMKRLAVLAIPLVVLACTSSNDYSPAYPQQPGGSGGGNGGGYGRGGGQQRAANIDAALDMLPPAEWWRQPVYADAVRLKTDQITALDKIAEDHSNDVERIQMDMGVALRDFRTQLNAEQVAQADIVAAGNRIKELRNSMFDKQLQTLAAERTVLTYDQWEMLQQQIQVQRQQQRNEGMGNRPGGRGQGRGRWPGY